VSGPVMEIKRKVYLECRICGMRTHSLDEEHVDGEALQTVRRMIEKEHMKKEHPDEGS
jgi:hypothetical protein